MDIQAHLSGAELALFPQNPLNPLIASFQALSQVPEVRPGPLPSCPHRYLPKTSKSLHSSLPWSWPITNSLCTQKEVGRLKINPTPPKALVFALCDIRGGRSLGEMDGADHKGPKQQYCGKCSGLADPFPRGSGKLISTFSLDTSVFCDPKRLLYSEPQFTLLQNMIRTMALH